MFLAQYATWRPWIVRRVWFRGDGVREGWNGDSGYEVMGEASTVSVSDGGRL